MHKIFSQQKHILLFLPIFLIVAAAAYYIGTQQYKPKGQVIDAKTHFDERDAATKKFDRLTNDYDSACYNYQDLYAAYDTLYDKVGANSGLERKARIDGARGNEESCYR